MKNITCLSIIVLLFACDSINSNNNVITIQDFTEPNFFFSDLVDNIEIIKLDDSILIADGPTLVADDSSYYIYNRKQSPFSAKTKENVLLKFSKSGKFQYCIGDNGRGPNEYIFAKNFQIKNDTIYMYYYPNLSVNRYLKSGKFISKQSILMKEASFGQAYEFNNHYLSYREGVNFSYWVNMFDEKGDIIQKYLPRNPKTCPYFTTENFFIPYKNEILIRDVYSDTIYSINSKSEIGAHLIMDFKIKPDPKEVYLNSSHPKGDLAILANSRFYEIRRYYENDNYIIMELYHNIDVMNHDYYYVLKDKKSNMSYWVNFKGDKFLKANLRYMDDSCIYFMVIPIQLDTISTAFRTKLINKEVLNNLDPYGNSLILKMEMK
jgi:hypothetical protein